MRLKMSVEIEDTYAEAFEGLYFRVLVTADDEETLKKAAEDATATPSIVIGRIEGGIEISLYSPLDSTDHYGGSCSRVLRGFFKRFLIISCD